MAVFNTEALKSRLGLVRVFAALFTCVAFSLVVHSGLWSGGQGSWCIFSWTFSFVVSLLVVLLEVTGMSGKVPVSWTNTPITLAALCGLLCLSASVIYPLYFLGGRRRSGEAFSHGVAATVFSCLASLAYAVEVWLSRGRPGQTLGYMATIPGLLKVVEAFTAGVIFAFVSAAGYSDYPALSWCLAVYSLCFIAASILIVLSLAELTSCLPNPLQRTLSIYALLCSLLYASAMVLWPLYCFSARYGQPQRPSACGSGHGCQWDNKMAVAVLTGLNLLVYVADMVYSTRVIFITTSSS